MDDFYSILPLGQKTLSRAREVRAGGVYHVFNRRQDREVVFVDDADRAEFMQIAKRLLRPDRYRDERGRRLKSFADRITLLAFCVLDNHYHLVLRAHDEKAVEEFMHCLMTAFTKRRNGRHGTTGPLFDQPYQCVPSFSTRQTKHLIAYVNANVDDAANYRFSSHRLYLDHAESGQPHPWCGVEEGLRLFRSLETYLDWYNRASARRQARQRARTLLRRPW